MSGMNEFNTALGTVRWEADSQGVKITFRRSTRQIGWAEVSAAGLVSFSEAGTPAGMPTDILPGLGKLFELNRWQARELRQLVLARGRSSFRTLRIPIPVSEPRAALLVEELRSYLPGRWVGEVSMEEHIQALGLATPWWLYPLFVAGFIGSGLAILLAVGAFQALEDGGLAAVPVLAWGALLFWLILVGGIYLFYRRR